MLHELKMLLDGVLFQLGQIAPWWICGLVLGSLVSVYCSQAITGRMVALGARLPTGISVCAASLLGLASPLCMFGTVPLIAALGRKGVPQHLLAAFMISSVLLNPNLLAVSFALGARLALLRLLLCFVAGSLAGALVRLLYRGKPLFRFERFAPAHGKPPKKLLPDLLKAFRITLPYLLVGIVITALCDRYIPQSLVAALFGSHRGLGTLFATVLSIPLYACGGGSIPLVKMWLGAGMGTGEAEALPSGTEEEEPQPLAVAEGMSGVFVQRGTDGTDGGVRQLLEKMALYGQPFYRTESAPDGIIGANDVVLLKINCQWAERGGTNTDLILSVARAVAAHPDGFTGEIVVADNGQQQYGSGGTGGSLDWDKANSQNRDQSALDVVDLLKAEGVRISGYLWDDITMNAVGEYNDGDMQDGFVVGSEILGPGLEITYPKFTSEYGTHISFKYGVWDGGGYDAEQLRLINMPVLKVHALYQVTGAVKAYMGTVANRLTVHRAHNSVGAGGMGAQMAHTRLPDLNLLDMIWVGVEGGPGTSYDEAVQLDMVAASTDAVALDYWAAKHVLMPEIEKMPGQLADAQNPDGEHPGEFGYWLRLSAEELGKGGFTAHMGEENIQVIE